MVSAQGESAYIADVGVQLMLRASCGDDEAFESIYLAYHPRVLRVLTAMTSNHDQAQELSQEVFLRAFKARYRYRPKSLLITWLYRIARNVAFNSSRDRSALHASQLQSEGRHSQFASIIEQADGPPHLKRKELRESVWEAIATLGGVNAKRSMSSASENRATSTSPTTCRSRRKP